MSYCDSCARENGYQRGTINPKRLGELYPATHIHAATDTGAIIALAEEVLRLREKVRE